MLNYQRLFTSKRVNFYAYIELKLTVDNIQVENGLTFATVIVPLTEDWIPNTNPSTRFPLKHC